eukprot:GHVR01171757.1.p2 GENE.GHVR01171757.1~~GHVR01171757.1.p2  ORF type:complete len:104 (+),score=36.98 GHVR01171757.1:697-1008(+)
MEPPTTTTTTTTYEITRKQIGCTRKCIDRLDSNPNTHRTTHTIAPHTKIAQLNTCNTHTHTHTHIMFKHLLQRLLTVINIIYTHVLKIQLIWLTELIDLIIYI